LPPSPSEPIEAEVVGSQVEAIGDRPRELTESDLRSPGRRRVTLPLALFIATCLSTFWAGTTHWMPVDHLSGDLMVARRAVVRGWQEGLIYTGCVIGILLAHEMGHFLATLRYRIPASLPFFIPLPIAPLGTLGAVIGMDGKRANRRELFDIGLAGPIAGLVLAVPILWIGIDKLDLPVANPELPVAQAELIEYDVPLLGRWMMQYHHPRAYRHGMWISDVHLNPYLMAGWVGMLVTGLNMIPMSQLDGGHVLYTLFGRKATWLARALVFGAIAYVVFGDAGIWALMLILVILIGIDHPKTADDRVPLGGFRVMLGCASLAIPILCLPVRGLRIVGM